MSSIIRKARVLLSSYAYMLEYRAELFCGALSACRSSDDGSLDRGCPRWTIWAWPLGLCPSFAVFIIRQSTVVWVIYEFEKEVVEGRLSPLLQPLDPVWHHVASHLSERLARLPLPWGWWLFFHALPQAFWVPRLGILLFVLAVLAFACALSSSTPLPYWPSGLSELMRLRTSGFVLPVFGHDRSAGNVRACAGSGALDSVPYLIHFPAALLMGYQWSSAGFW